MTKVSANEFNWEKGDIFVVPSWQWHSHENTTDEDAILFSITGRPRRCWDFIGKKPRGLE
jgi:gentisate 1,2-dioxygenase